MKNVVIMLIVFLLAFLSIPVVMVVMGQLNNDRLASVGLRTNLNYSGGTVLAQFADPADDLLQPVPEAFAAYAHALDIRSFAVTKVAFPRFTGQGIAPRLNLVFEFDGKLPNPQDSRQQFSLPVVQVFLDAPGQSSSSVTSARIPQMAFTGPAWDYQVVLDGLHEQARIYDTAGTLIGESLAIYVKYLTDDQTEEIVSKTDMPDSKKDRPITATRLTAALPISLVGDPAVGAWAYYVVVGLPDLRNPSGMEARPLDCFQCRLRASDGVIEVFPLRTGAE